MPPGVGSGGAGRWTVGTLSNRWLGFRAVGAISAGLAVALALPAAMPGPAFGQAAQPQMIVRSVLVSGSDRVETEQILDAIRRTQPGRPLSRESVEADLQAILELGYFRSVSVDVQEVAEGPLAGEAVPVRVIFRVVENPVLRRVEVAPETKLEPLLAQQGIKPADVAELLGLQTGKVAHQPTIARALQELPGRMWQQYGVLAAAGVVQLTDDGALRVELRGIRVGRTLVTGNEKTREYVIRRELTLQPGDILLRSELERSLRRVLMLQFFDEVNADLKPASDPQEGGDQGDERVDVVVHVTERRTALAQIGLTFTADSRLAGLVEVSDINFLGRGQSLGVSINYGPENQRYELNFTEPHMDERRTSLGTRLGYQKLPQDGYYDVRYGGELSVGRPLSEFTRGFVTLVHNVWAPQAKPGDTLPLEAEAGVLGSLGIGTVTDTSDHPFNPTRGNRLRLSLSVAGLWGDFHFNKLETTLTHYIPLSVRGATHVLAGRLSAGQIVGGAPDQELFRVGGSEGLRGYDRIDPDLKGSTMLLANLEYRFPIAKPVSGVVFVDAGRAWPGQDAVDLRQLRWDAGVGIRVDVPPLGMIRLDYGMTRESGGRFHFSIGQAF